jgi:hypothetical protein
MSRLIGDAEPKGGSLFGGGRPREQLEQLRCQRRKFRSRG